MKRTLEQRINRLEKFLKIRNEGTTIPNGSSTVREVLASYLDLPATASDDEIMEEAERFDGVVLDDIYDSATFDDPIEDLLDYPCVVSNRRSKIRVTIKGKGSFVLIDAD